MGVAVSDWCLADAAAATGGDLLSLAAFAAAHPTYSAAQAIHYLCA
jgi:hypothetical protein